MKHHVYVVSDLHLGGRAPSAEHPGFQMCPPLARRRLARWIGDLANRGAAVTMDEGTVELVINGDFVDFLAEEPFEAFTFEPDVALSKLEAAIAACDDGADAGERVFEQLAAFVRAGHKLTVLLGNHDLELSLPDVRRALLHRLTAGMPSRVEFIYDGEAYRLGELLVEHGNRYDGWNAVAYGALRALRSTVSRSEKRWNFAPPAGSRLVKQVMNRLKPRYRFIDLLKPENEVVLPLLIALEPEVVYLLPQIGPLYLRRKQGPPGQAMQHETYIAGTSPTPPDPDADGDPRWVERTRNVMEQAVGRGAQVLGEAWANRRRSAEEFLDSGLSWSRQGAGGWGRRHEWLVKTWQARAESIGATFALGERDGPYVNAAERLCNEGAARVIVMGHSHLPRAIPLAGDGLYLNCGTWCPTIELPREWLSADLANLAVQQQILAFFDDLRENRLDCRTQLNTCFAHVALEGENVEVAHLCEVSDGGQIEVRFSKPAARAG